MQMSDLQYFIWHGDTTGRLLWEAAWQAAERGVRVRMLPNDANTAGLDATIGALDAHSRLFNPFANRGFRIADRDHHRDRNASSLVSGRVKHVDDQSRPD